MFIKLNIKIGINVKIIDLYYFDAIDYTFETKETNNLFTYSIKENKLYITNSDNYWNYKFSVDICIKSQQKIYLLLEKTDTSGYNSYVNSYVLNNNVKIFDSRDLDYHKCKKKGVNL